MRYYGYILVFFLISSPALPNIEKKCSEIQSDQSGEKFICYGIDLSPKVTEKLEDMETVSTSLQEWLWLNDKLKKGIEDNKNKVESLDRTKESFTASLSKPAYPNEKNFVEQFREVEGYKKKYEELYEATKSESMLHQALQSCYGTSFRCPQDSIQDLKVRYTKAQSKKLSILMSNPLLSSDSIRESIEKQLETFHEFGDKDIDDRKFSSTKELEDHQKKQRRELLPSLMLSGIENIEEAMNDREKKWKIFQKRYEDVGMRKLGLKEKSSRAPRMLRPTVSSVQRRESGIINEILLGQDVEADLNDPHLGKAICQVHKTQNDQLSVEDRNQMILDGTLMVAPFFLGPLGAAARMASMGRVANWGVKGRVMISAAVEGSLLGVDYLEITNKAEQCQSNFLNSLNPGSVKDLQEKKHKLTTTCEEELDQQIMFAMGGVALGPIAFMYGKAGRVTGKLSEESNTIIKSYNKSKNMKELKGLFDELDLPKSDRDALEIEYAKLKDSSNESGAPLLKKFRLRLEKEFGISCKI